jgi:site-specific recombinase XerD
VKPFKNRWGSVKPYSRHISGCAREDDSCSCPKWLYVNQRGQQSKRYSLSTPSWAEALELATDKLNALNPEIAASRAEKQEAEASRKTVYEAINLWLDRTRTQFGERSAIVKQYRSTFGWVDKDGVRHGLLFRFATDYKLEYIDELTPLLCQQLLSSTSTMKAYSRHQRWSTVRSFFKYLLTVGVLKSNPVRNIPAPPVDAVFAHAPFADEQYTNILSQADWYVDERVRNGEREVYTQRIHSLLELLRWTGMDIVDAVLLNPAQQITKVKIDGKIQYVLRYSREKTGYEAIIPIDARLAKMLREVPPAPKSVDGMPFRYVGNEVQSDVNNWSRRIHRLFELAKITAIQLMRRDGKSAIDKQGNRETTKPHVKMLRHTFAVGELVRGVPEEQVAKMLGHVGTDMIRKHYAPWCKARDEAHIRTVLASRRGKLKGA